MKFGFVTVYVDNMNASVDYYIRVLGFKISRQFSPKENMDITFLQHENGNLVEFIQEKNADNYHGKGIALGFQVDEMTTTLKHLNDHQVEITSGPELMPNGVTLLKAKDLNGLGLIFVQGPKE